MTFAEENAGKVEFLLQPAVRSPAFAAAAHADKPRGRRPRALCRSCCGLQLSSLQHCWDPGRALGQPCSQGCPTAQKYTQPLQSPSARALQLSCHGAGTGENTSERPQIWVSHMKVKKGRSLVSLSAIPMVKNKPLQSRNWCTTKPGSVFHPRGRERAEHEPDLVQLLSL